MLAPTDVPPQRRKTHYCVWCDVDMMATEERECPKCDGDLCVPRKHLALAHLPDGHPRVIAAKKRGWRRPKGKTK